MTTDPSLWGALWTALVFLGFLGAEAWLLWSLVSLLRMMWHNRTR
jgi:hypothetical protein